MKILVIAEHDSEKLKSATLHTLTAAKELGDEIDLLIMGYQCQKVVSQAMRLPCLKQILLADNAVYQHQLAENSAELIAQIGKNYHAILIGATTFGKNMLPRVAALLDSAMIS